MEGCKEVVCFLFVMKLGRKEVIYMDKELVQATQKLVDYAWNQNLSGINVGLYLNEQHEYCIYTDSDAAQNGLNTADALIIIKGGIAQVDLVQFTLTQLCQKLQRNQLAYLYNTLISNKVIMPGTPANAIKVTPPVEAFIAALFPQVLDDFYNQVVKHAQLKKVCETMNKDLVHE